MAAEWSEEISRSGMGGGAKSTGPHDLPFVVQWPWRRVLKYVFIVSLQFAVRWRRRARPHTV